MHVPKPTSAGPPSGEPTPVHLTVAYNGTRYRGWQIQPLTKTVQGELQGRLQRILRCPDLRLAGTSRTDAGVHALDQHASFFEFLPPSFDPQDLRATLNRWLPPDIRVLRADRTTPDFHARHSAKAKAYTYVVNTAPDASPFETGFLWHCTYPLDIGRMRAAAGLMVGTHEMAVFGVNPRNGSEPETVKTIHAVQIISRPPYLFFSIIGNSFLYKMVRSMAGYLVMEAGRKASWTPDHLTGLLTPGAERPPDLQTAPPQGLFLGRVFFEDNAWSQYTPCLPPYTTNGLGFGGG